MILQAEHEGIRTIPETGEAMIFPWEGMQATVGGFDDSYLILRWPTLPGQELWLTPAELEPWSADPSLPPSARLALGEWGREHGGRHRRRAWARVGWAVLGISVVLWFIQGGLIDVAVSWIPPSIESQVGALAAEAVIAERPACVDPEVAAAVGAVFERLCAAAGPQPWTPRVQVLRSDEVNAFALPGGQLFVLSGLLEEVESADELAAVLGHEIHHATLRHALRALTRRAGVGLAVAITLGDASEAAQLLAAYAGDLSTLRFGRGQELEADEAGLALVMKAGFDSEGAISIFGKLAERNGEESGILDRAAAVFSTHPASEERQERLRRLAKTLPRGDPAPPMGDWAAIQTACSTPAVNPGG